MIELVPLNPNTRPALEERIAALGGRHSWRERWRRPVGSPYVWYAGGWAPLDAVADRAPDLLRLGFERLRGGLLLHAAQRHDAWVAAFAEPLDWRLGAEDAEGHRDLALGGLALRLRVPPQHRGRFARFAEGLHRA